MEAAADAVLAGNTHEVADFTPPAGFPALPAELGDRAREIARKQQDALANATSLRSSVGKQLNAVSSVHIPRYDTGKPAVYLDVTG
jgi:hypothetical protein